MRLPTTDGKPGTENVDEAESIRMIRRAIDGGVNYLDSAYIYHNGVSEVVLGKALRDGYRERVRVATKSPTWLINAPGDFDRILDEQLKRLGTDYIDFYLLHGLTKQRWHEVVLKHNLLAKSEAAIRDGRIRHLGFSFHDNYEAFGEIVPAYDWTFCQIQYNYMDIENQAGTKGLKLAAERGIAVVIMEPILGGRLADPPAMIRESMERYPLRRTPAEWALSWLWDQPEVSIVLSGMSTMEQVEENLRTADLSKMNAFTAEDHELIRRVREQYQSRTAIPCTKCNYCMPCVNGVEIPINFEFFNYAHLYDDIPGARFRYSVFLKPEQRASECLACKECEDKCPQGILISEWMPRVSELLTQPKA